MPLELGLAWAAVVAFTLGSLAGWLVAIWQRPGPAKAVIPALGAGLALLGASLLLRWIRIGHGPYISALEVLSSSVWIGALVLLLVVWRTRLYAIAAPALGASVVLMGWGILGSAEVQQLPPTFRGVWLVIHILFAKIAYGAILVATGTAVFWLLRSRRGARDEELSDLDRLAARLIGLGFVACTFMLASGALWAQNAWGRYWAWDPIETWALITWLAYGIFLHLRLTFQVRGGRSMWLIMALFALSILAFFVIARFIPTIHTEFMVEG